MRLTLLGCGQMGRAAGYGLATSRVAPELVLVDRDRERAVSVARWLRQHSNATVAVGDVEASLDRTDGVAVAAPWSATWPTTRAALRRGVPVASIARPDYADLPDLAEADRAAGGRALLPVGLEPGLTEVLASHLGSQLDRAEEVEIRCGGIPRDPREPLCHTVWFGGGRLPIAQRPAFTMRDGRLAEVPRFSEVEAVRIPGVGMFEAYHDGMVPWLADHPALASIECAQKTLRWPGFAEVVTHLAQLGLLDDRPLDVDGVAVPPLRVVERVLAPHALPRPADEDLVVLDVLASGVAEGRAVTLRSTLTDTFDRDTGLSAMARVTGFTLAACIRMLVDGTVTGDGWLRPHLALTDAALTRLREDLQAQGVMWTPARPRGAGAS
jgi:saccharopine dehydrogenase-like NADP-dependent oxidoreductase